MRRKRWLARLSWTIRAARRKPAFRRQFAHDCCRACSQRLERSASYQAARGGVHLAFARTRVVVVADEMQEPVREQEAHFGDEFALARACLAQGRVDRNHHVAEPATFRIFTALIEREREYVGWAILLTMLQ